MKSISKTRIRLQVKYEKSNGKYHRFSIKNVDRDVSAEKIKSSLGKLAIVDLFDQEGVGFFKKAVEAKFVETTESKIFDKQNDESTLHEKQPKAATEENTIRIPEDLIITEERPESGIMIQKLGCLRELISKNWMINKRRQFWSLVCTSMLSWRMFGLKTIDLR